jgi:outer membrane protein assembly factor BamD
MSKRIENVLKRPDLRRGASKLACAVAIAILAGCASSSDLTSSINTDTPEKMYADADTLMNKGSFSDAAAKFEDLDRSHPYSPEARRSIVLAAYAYYKAGKTPEAVASAERYVVMHPGTKALEQLKILKSRYPDSSYAKDSENRIRIVEDNLAAAEMEVGRYYLKQNNYSGSINRFKTVVSDYQTTAHVEEALARLVECYMALGIVNEAQTAAAVLGHNFPESKWYKDSYTLLASGGLAPREDGDSWITKAWKSAKFSLGGPN